MENNSIVVLDGASNLTQGSYSKQRECRFNYMPRDYFRGDNEE